ncbi:MAG: TIGR03560 family F420-dependent LLM class oxidoreductase [Anaerolineae bacterium]|nr:TIGR03560 family F420-dependent LLM class oxidoreductase [Anaerolineae bacterium]
MTQIGLMIEGQWGLTWARWAALLKAAEEYGFQCVFRSDHFTIGPPDDDSLETWVSLTYAASHTSRIEFGTLVCPTTFRHPALTARMAAAVDDLSGGRLVLGLGTGWHEREHRQFGIPFYDKATRYEMLKDALEVTTRLFHSDEPVSYDGAHYPLDEAILLPRPQRAGGPPILIGGNGMTKTLPLAARYADEWNGVHIAADGYQERNQRLDELAVEAGRQPGDIKRSLMTAFILGKDDADLKRKIAAYPDQSDKLLEPSQIVGTASEVVDQIAAFAEAGASRLMLMHRDQTDMETLELMARDVLPHFHK